MDSFSKKEQERIRVFEQLRKQLQMIFVAHIRLIILLFVLSLATILSIVYIKWHRSTKRYETQVVIHYIIPDRADKTKTMDPKLVLDIMQRKDTTREFFKKIGKFPNNWKPWQCQIHIEPIEKNRMMDRYKITVTAPDEKLAVTIAGKFAEHCIATYAEKHTAMLKKQREQLEVQKDKALGEISRIEEDKKKLCEGKHIPDPQGEFKQLQKSISDAKREISKETPELEAKRSDFAVLDAECKKFNPALVENAVELRKRIEARKKLDAEVEQHESEFQDTNPKMINIRERRAAMEATFQKFLKDKNLSEADLDQLETAVKKYAEREALGAKLRLQEEKVRMHQNQIRTDEERLTYLREVMPQIDKLNELQRTQRESLNKLISSISDIDSKLPTVGENMRIGDRGSAKKITPFANNKIVFCIIGALLLTMLLGSLIVALDFTFGSVSGEKELQLLSEIHYLGALPTKESLFESKAQEQIAFNTIYHTFISGGAENHIVLASALPGGKLLPGLFEYFDNCETMSGKRMLAIDVVLAESFDYETPSAYDTGILYCSGSRGYMPVISKRFLSPSEVELLRNDLLILRETYDLIIIKHSASMRHDRMFIEQIVPLCDSALFAVGCRRTSRKNLRRIVSINRKTGLSIMTILSDSARHTVEKHNNLEIGS